MSRKKRGEEDEQEGDDEEDPDKRNDRPSQAVVSAVSSLYQRFGCHEVSLNPRDYASVKIVF
jgi:hypothetical protein